MTRAAWRPMLALFAFEVKSSLKSPLAWAALACLGFLVLPVGALMENEFSVNGQPVGQPFRLVYVLAVEHSIVAFLTTLFTLCLCLERTGPHYLRNHDLLILSRGIGRTPFYLAKLSAILIPSLAYAALGLLIFWEEVYRKAGVNLYQLFLLILPLGLSMLCLVSLYLLMRNLLSNFMIFFLWLLLLPVIYVGNLWRYYGGVLRESTFQLPILGWLPQFGGIHAHSLGMAHDFFRRDETWLALGSGCLWAALGLAGGIAVFSRKRL